MPIKPPVFRPPYAPRPGDYEATRQAIHPWRRWYGLQTWQKLRKAQLAKEPLCFECAKGGRVTVATTVHHIRPHRGDFALFHDPANLQSVCGPCHNSVIQSREARGESE